MNFPPIDLIYGPLVMFNQDIILAPNFGSTCQCRASFRIITADDLNNFPAVTKGIFSFLFSNKLKGIIIFTSNNTPYVWKHSVKSKMIHGEIIFWLSKDIRMLTHSHRLNAIQTYNAKKTVLLWTSCVWKCIKLLIYYNLFCLHKLCYWHLLFRSHRNNVRHLVFQTVILLSGQGVFWCMNRVSLIW